MIAPTVFVVDDDAAVRDSLRWLLESLQLKVETFESAEQFLDNYSIYRIGCLLLDLRMPGMSGLQLQQRLAEQKHALPIIIITGHGDIPVAVRAVKNGAYDFIEKPFDNDRLVERVKEALALDQENHPKRLALDAVNARIANLTPREKQVLEFVIDNHSNKEIAAKLGVSIKTVEFHRARVMEKMHADSLLHLAQMVASTRA
ncbi:MAG: response regulator transcription factor [Thiotrichales bacterium]